MKISKREDALWAFGITLVLLLAFAMASEAQGVRVYCQDMVGRITIHNTQCPFGQTFVGVVE
ncbi:MAG: hypothetical protein ACRCVD_13750 [Halioglobus sp.]